MMRYILRGVLLVAVGPGILAVPGACIDYEALPQNLWWLAPAF